MTDAAEGAWPKRRLPGLKQGRSWQCCAQAAGTARRTLALLAAVTHTMLVELWVTEVDVVGAGHAACHHCLEHGRSHLQCAPKSTGRPCGAQAHSAQEVCASYSDCS
jgi:hypothetical protein